MVDKSRFITRSNFSNKIIRVEKLSEIHIHKNNLSVSFLSVQGEILSSKKPYTLRILCNKLKKKTPDTLIIRKHLFKSWSIQGKGQKKII